MKLKFAPWRILLALSGVLVLVGSMNHPRGGGMAQMLAHPDWWWSHAMLAVGFAALLVGLLLHRRDVELPPASDRWSKWAILGAALQTVEMVFHTAAAVDAAAYAAGETAPVFAIHMALTVLFNPLFSILMIGLIWVGARQRALGSMAIAWLGLLGAAAHGLAPILVVVLGLGQFAILFPMVMLFALYLVLVAFWPIRVAARGRAAAIEAEAG